MRRRALHAGSLFGPATIAVAALGCAVLAPPQPSTWGFEPGQVRLGDEVVATLDSLHARVSQGEGVEWFACLHGEEHGPVFRVVEAQPLPHDRNTRERVVRSDCGFGWNGSGHSHPGSATCARSAEDRAWFWRNGDQFMVVWCDDGYRWYTRNGEQGYHRTSSPIVAAGAGFGGQRPGDLRP